jgi:hypothetical protein
MQEPQYRSPGVRELDAVAKSRVPCIDHNMPPLPYVKRIPGLNYDALKPAYTDPSVWDSRSGDADAQQSRPAGDRPPEEKVNVLMVTLPTFKVARFESEGQPPSCPAREGRRSRAIRSA